MGRDWNNDVTVEEPTPTTVRVNEPIQGIKVRATGPDSVDVGDSEIGIVKDGVYAKSCSLRDSGQTEIYVPTEDVLAVLGDFKLRAYVRYSDGMPIEPRSEDDSETFTGEHRPPPTRRVKAKKTGAGKAKVSRSRTAKTRSAKRGARSKATVSKRRTGPNQSKSRAVQPTARASKKRTRKRRG